MFSRSPRRSSAASNSPDHTSLDPLTGRVYNACRPGTPRGRIDIEHVLPFGTVAGIETYVKQVPDLKAPGSGQLHKAQAFSPLTPYEDLSAAYNLALDYSH